MLPSLGALRDKRDARWTKTSNSLQSINFAASFVRAIQASMMKGRTRKFYYMRHNILQQNVRISPAKQEIFRANLIST